MSDVAIIVLVIVAAAAVVGLVGWLVYLLKNKDAADLSRYLRGDSCQWQQRTATAGGAGSVYFTNRAPEAQGIEMRVYYYSAPADGSPGDDDGYCLSIIDQGNGGGVILNGFARPLEAMQFGDGLWNERFLGDAGIMEEVITEKRTAWDQEQREVIVAHYAMFM